MKIYIDFDGTLFNSTLQYQKLIDIFNKYDIKEDYILSLMEKNFFKKQKNYIILAERIIKEKKLNPNIKKEIDNTYSSDLVYNDAINFLKKYYKKYELILLTLGNIEHQEKKIKISKLKKYFKDIIITNKDKSKLNIDYANGIFIDNNPHELEKFHHSKAKHLIRIKRENDKYSKIPLNIKNIPEFKNFNELLISNYIDKIGENYE